MKYIRLPPGGDFQPKLEFENGAILSDELIMDIKHYIAEGKYNSLDELCVTNNIVLSELEKAALKLHLQFLTKSKYKVGQYVWFLADNMTNYKKIASINYVDTAPNHSSKYTYCFDGCSVLIPEYDVYLGMNEYLRATRKICNELLANRDY